MEISKIVSNKLVGFGLLFILGVGLRLLPHAPNFTAVGAIALFAGAVLSARSAILLPLMIMVVSDLIIGFYPGIVYTWLGFVLVGCFGMVFRKASLHSRILLGSLGGSVIFFIVSNFGVWQAGDLYQPTPAGLVECFVMAVPFFGATLASSLVYSSVLFGVKDAARLIDRTRTRKRADSLPHAGEHAHA